MQQVSTNFTASSGGNNTLHYPIYGVNISWTKQENVGYGFFTIGTSSIGGNDFIPGSGTAPSFANQYKYTDYAAYMLSGSVTRNIGQYTYGAFGAQSEVQLNNTTLLFMPGYDPVIGNYIITGRPINIATGFTAGTNSVDETVNLFYGQTTKPQNDIDHRQITLDGFDFFDFLQSFQSKAAGPIAAANNGCYINQYANVIIGDLLSEAGLATSQYIAEQSTQSQIGFYSPYGLFIGDIIQALCEAEQALFFFDENGIAHFWNRQHLITNDSPVWTFDETDTFQLTPEDTPIINDVQILANPRAVQGNQKIWEQTVATAVPAPNSTTTFTNLCRNPTFYIDSIINWSVTGGALVPSEGAGWNDIYFASLTSTGTSQYASTTINCAINTAYVAQCRVQGTPGAVITIEAVENAVSLGSATVVLDSSWDLLSLPSFTTDGTHTSFDIRIYPTTSQVVNIDAVMVQLAFGATPTYFDGNKTTTSNYLYTWAGTTYFSASVATPCATVTIEADFQDDFGVLPVSSVKIPLWYQTNPATSIFRANTADDNSGNNVPLYVSVVGTSLVNQPDSAATLSGSKYFVTFASTYSLPVFITQLELWGTPAKITYQINYEYQDQASIALYGGNPTNNGQPLLIENDLIQSPSTAQSNATVLVTDYSTPFKRIVADITPVPQLQIGDAVTLGINDITDYSFMPSGLLLALMQQQQSYSYSPYGLLLALTQPQILPIYTEYTVVGISHSFTDDSPMSQILELEEKILASYFTIGLSTIGGSDSLAPG
jgi:hypothetical protein